jgi:hypothetical protein
LGGVAYAHLGAMDAAFESANRAVDQRDPIMLTSKHSPFFEPLHSDPRYPALLARMNLA